jgi:hypothetical protein
MAGGSETIIAAGPSVNKRLLRIVRIEYGVTYGVACPGRRLSGHALRRSRSHAHAYSGVGMPPGNGSDGGFGPASEPGRCPGLLHVREANSATGQDCPPRGAQAGRHVRWRAGGRGGGPKASRIPGVRTALVAPRGRKRGPVHPSFQARRPAAAFLDSRSARLRIGQTWGRGEPFRGRRGDGPGCLRGCRRRRGPSVVAGGHSAGAPGQRRMHGRSAA